MRVIVFMQSHRTTDRAAFARALSAVREQRVRAVRVSAATNEYGHTRGYQVAGRWEAARLADAAFDQRLITWQK